MCLEKLQCCSSVFYFTLACQIKLFCSLSRELFVQATNKHGEASVSCKLQVHGRQGIIMEPQLPSNFRSGTESLQKLEEALYKREELKQDAEQPNPPKFTVELKVQVTYITVLQNIRTSGQI